MVDRNVANQQGPCIRCKQACPITRSGLCQDCRRTTCKTCGAMFTAIRGIQIECPGCSEKSRAKAAKKSLTSKVTTLKEWEAF